MNKSITLSIFASLLLLCPGQLILCQDQGILAGQIFVENAPTEFTMEEVTILCLNADGEEVVSVSPSVEGEYTIILPAGEYRIIASAAGMATFDTGDSNIIIAVERETSFNIALTPLEAMPPEQEEVIQESKTVTSAWQRFTLGNSYGERHCWFVAIKKAGKYKMELRWLGSIENLSVLIETPTGQTKRFNTEENPSSIEFPVSEGELASGNQWVVSVVNFSTGSVTEGEMRLPELLEN